MRLNKNSLLIIGIITDSFGLVIFYNFLVAIDMLRPGD